MELEIQTLAYGGRGVARRGGEVWFVSGALPGERVVAAEERRRRGIVEARVVDVLSCSSWREPEPCPKALGACGGCDFAHVAIGFREKAYKVALFGALRGAPESLAQAVAKAVFVPSPWYYRLRGRLHWAPEAGQLGFFASSSHRVADLGGCRVLSQELLALLPAWAQCLQRAGVPAGELEFLEDVAAKRRLLLFRGAFSGHLPRLPGVDGFWGLRGRGWGERELILELPLPLAVPVGAFVQGNRFLLSAIWNTVAAVVREGGFLRVLDLYGGVGFLAAAAQAGGAQEVTVVEVSKRAAQAARANLPQARVLPMPAEVAVGQGALGGASLLILDPPRGGLSPAVRQAVASSQASAVLYISCDAACLARDAWLLQSGGFAVRWAKLFDLFAGTHHVELAVLFQRA